MLLSNTQTGEAIGPLSLGTQITDDQADPV